MVGWTNWLSHCPFKAVIRGSNPLPITKIVTKSEEGLKQDQGKVQEPQQGCLFQFNSKTG